MWPRADNRALQGEPGPSAYQDPGSRQTAVIDVGSNSVRLVIYRLEGRAIWTVFNEKALAGFGRDLPATGRLSPEGVETALTALRRYRAALSGWSRTDIFAVATIRMCVLANPPASRRDFLRHQRIGIDIMTPPLATSALRPRSSRSGVFGPTLRSQISP